MCLSKLREIRNCSFNAWKHCKPRFSGAIALSYPPTVRVRAMVKLSAAFFNDESSIGGYESAIVPEIPHVFVHLFFI